MYKTILVPLDGSTSAEAILPHAENMALNYQAKVLFLRVVESGYFMPAYRDGIDIGGYQQEYERREKETASYLDGLCKDFTKKGINAEKIVVHGSVVQCILNAAESENADLIAIASHGRTGLSRAFYGSVAAGVLNGADRPLLIVRSRKKF